jgi:hypothetical protein
MDASPEGEEEEDGGEKGKIGGDPAGGGGEAGAIEQDEQGGAASGEEGEGAGAAVEEFTEAEQPEGGGDESEARCAAAWGGVVAFGFPFVDRQAVDPAQGGEEGTEEEKRMVAGHAGGVAMGLIPGGEGGGGGEEQADDEFLRDTKQRPGVCRRGQMHEHKVEERERAEDRVVEEERARHAGDEHGECDADRQGGCEEGAAVLVMEVVTRAQGGRGREPGVEEAVCDVEEPCPEGEREGQPGGEALAGGKAEGPAPECGDGGRVEAEQVPVAEPFGGDRGEDGRHSPV